MRIAALTIAAALGAAALAGPALAGPASSGDPAHNYGIVAPAGACPAGWVWHQGHYNRWTNWVPAHCGPAWR